MPLILLIILLLLSPFTDADTMYGIGADKSKLVPITTVLTNIDDYVGQTITVSGKIDSVCKKKGCWMEFLADGGNDSIRIKVKDGVMVFPVAAKGKKGLATGMLSKRELSLEQTKKFFKHQAEEQGAEFDESSITEARIIVQLNPVGVTIKD